MSCAVAKPDHVAVAEHDVIRARAAVDRLVEVVAHRVIVREALEVRSIALLNVIEPHRGRAFSGRLRRGRVFRAEVRRLCQSIGACTRR